MNVLQLVTALLRIFRGSPGKPEQGRDVTAPVTARSSRPAMTGLGSQAEVTRSEGKQRLPEPPDEVTSRTPDDLAGAAYHDHEAVMRLRAC